MVRYNLLLFDVQDFMKDNGMKEVDMTNSTV